jgi:DHA2 family multidrug resistance protein
MLAMTASQQLAISNLPVSQMKDASGLINLMRNVGGAIGLALLTTLITHQNAVHYSELAAAANIANPYTAAMMDGITAMVAEGGAADPESVARKAMGMMLHRQANVLSFADAFAALAVACWLTAGFAFFARAPNKIHAQAEEGH